MSLKTIVAVALVVGCLALPACGPEDTQVALPPNAVASTPLANLPVNAAFRQTARATATPVPQEIIDAADAEYLLLTNIYQRIAPSVVNIDIVISTPHPGLGDRSSGSGFIYDDSGHIVTNAHVVQDAEEVRVTFNDGYVTVAEVLGADPYSDLAVLKVDTDPSRLVPVVIGDSDAVRVGQRAIAIGNPFGLASSMTVGIVSGLGRQLPSARLLDLTNLSQFNNPSIIQVDTNINPGNSGGPLLNSRGEVIGVNTAISTESGTFQGVGFAVPSRTLQRVVPELIETGRVNYAWIGISSLSAEDGFGVAALAEPLNLPVTAGVLIDTVSPNSPAAKAGLRGGTRQVMVRGVAVCAGGDIIVAVDGVYIQTMDELLAYLVANGRPGDTIDLLIVRGEETFEVPLVLEERPQTSVVPECGE
ncbi:MAG: trypsin-like peptidase domain-containing protein [Chloroflexota bacterium]|nr:MAG: 2-alkenal reductase [Chloroflexota bacterium]